MKRILFTHSYFLRLDPKQWKAGQPYAPLGTLYAATLMRENNYEVRVQDTMFANSPDEIMASIQTFQPDCFVIYDDGFNYLTKMCLTNMRQAAFEMIGLAKAYGCTVIISSSDSTDRYEQYLNAGADFILIGEAGTVVSFLKYDGSKNQSSAENRLLQNKLCSFAVPLELREGYKKAYPEYGFLLLLLNATKHYLKHHAAMESIAEKRQIQ